MYFIIFRIFYELLRIYQFLADLKNKRKINWRFYIGNLRKSALQRRIYNLLIYAHANYYNQIHEINQA